MLYTASVENSAGRYLTLTGNEKAYQVVSIAGLEPAHGQINLTNIAGMDGARFNSAKLETRNIVITVKLCGDVEENRLRLYSLFPVKDWVNFYYQNRRRNVFILGYVESVEVNHFDKAEVMQISLLCPFPYFQSVDEIIDDISKVTALFTFPFTINLNQPVVISELDTNKETNVVNDSESSTGLIIQVRFSQAVGKILIRKITGGDEIEVDYAFQPEDLLTINTNKGRKSITLTRNAETFSVFPYMKKGGTFFDLTPGDNYFSYSADDGASDTYVDITFRHFTQYNGV